MAKPQVKCNWFSSWTVRFKIRPTITFWVRTGKTRKATDSLVMSFFQSLAPWIRSPSQRTAPNKRASCLSCLNKDFSLFPICACCINEPITLSLRIKDHCPFAMPQSLPPTAPAGPSAPGCFSCEAAWCALCFLELWLLVIITLIDLLSYYWCWELIPPAPRSGVGEGFILFSLATTIHPSRVLSEEIRRQFGGWWGSFGCIVL